MADPEITEGSLYSGYSGMGMALRLASTLPVRTLWHCDPDPACELILRKTDFAAPNQIYDNRPVTPWSDVKRPDVVTLGPPCQPVSAGGLNLGADDPRWRWPVARNVLAALLPAVLFFENVSGLTHGRKLPLWLGILADMRALGYAVAWTVLGACVVGARMHRHRVFAVGRLRPDPPPAVRHGDRELCDNVRPLLPAPMARDGDPRQRGEGSLEYWRGRLQRRERQGIPLGAAVRLLPGPVAGEAKRGPGSVNGRGEPDLAGIVRLLPGPRASDARNGGPSQGIASGDLALSSAVDRARFGEFAPAVAYWESLTRSAPAPTEPTGRGGGSRLARDFPEWMMGLPAGHLTGHLARPDALRLAGNGVCPQQAAHAFRLLWPLI